MGLKVLFVSSEAVPFAKTGGLADVSGALPKALAALGCDVKVILPRYKMAERAGFALEEAPLTRPVEVAVGSHHYPATLQRHRFYQNFEFLFVVNDHFYGRPDLYRDPGTGFDYPDNDERFIFFARGTLEAVKQLGWQPDLIHCNDWQTALTPGYLKTVYRNDPFFAQTRTLLTLHNVAYQGNFPKETFVKLGVDPGLFHPLGPFEFWGKVNFLKAGIVYADLLSTVSERYAVEIQADAEFGYGLEGVLRQRNADLFGILNGVDYQEWNPATDQYIASRYTTKSLSKKKENKKALLKRCGWKATTLKQPLIGAISRLVDQKGFDLVADILEELLAGGARFVLLGTGERRYHELFLRFAQTYPDRMKLFLGFDEPLAHLIEAGSDMFLMPSRYEPCGLNQMYSLKYGTVPIVRETGGLADTVQEFSPGSANGAGTGFVFRHYDAGELLDAVRRALKVYEDQTAWKRLMLAGMTKDYSWETSAKKYLNLYDRAKTR